MQQSPYTATRPEDVDWAAWDAELEASIEERKLSERAISVDFDNPIDMGEEGGTLPERGTSVDFDSPISLSEGGEEKEIAPAVEGGNAPKKEGEPALSVTVAQGQQVPVEQLAKEYGIELPAKKTTPASAVDFENPIEFEEEPPVREDITLGEMFRLGFSDTATGAAVRATLGKDSEFAQERKRIRENLSIRRYREGSPLYEDVAMEVAYWTGNMLSPENLIGLKYAYLGMKGLDKIATQAIIRGGGVSTTKRFATRFGKAGAESAVSTAIGEGANVLADIKQGEDTDLGVAAQNVVMSGLTGGVIGGGVGVVKGRSLKTKTSQVSGVERIPGQGAWEERALFTAQKEGIGELRALVGTAKPGQDISVPMEAYTFDAMRQGYTQNNLMRELTEGFTDQGLTLEDAQINAGRVFNSASQRYADIIQQNEALAWKDRIVPEGEPVKNLIVAEGKLKSPSMDEVRTYAEDTAKIYARLAGEPVKDGLLGSTARKFGWLTDETQARILGDGTFRAKYLAQANAQTKRQVVNRLAKTQQKVAFKVLENRNSPLAQSWASTGALSRELMYGAKRSNMVRMPSGKMAESKPFFQIMSDAWRSGATMEDLEKVSEVMHYLDLNNANKVRGDRMLEKAQEATAKKAAPEDAAPEYGIELDIKERKQYVIDADGNRVRGEDGEELVDEYIPVPEERRDIDELLTELSAFKDNAGVQQYIRDRDKLNRLMLDMAVEVGEITNTTAQIIRSRNPNYTPVSYMKQEDVVGEYAAPSGNVASPRALLKKRKGSDTLRTDVFIEGYIRNISRHANNIEAKHLNREFINSLMDAPDEVWGMFVHGAKKSDFIAAMKKAEAGEYKTNYVKLWDPKEQEIELIRPERPNFTINVNGVKIGMWMKDTPLFADYTRIASTPFEKPNEARQIVDAALRGYTNFRRTGITAVDPTFAVRSYWRDQMEAALRLPSQLKLGRDFVPLYTPLRDWVARKYSPEFYSEFESGLGISRMDTAVVGSGLQARGGATSEDIARAMQDPSRARKAWDEYNAKWVEAFELAPRWSIYKRLRDKGVGHTEALEQAKQISTDLFTKSSDPKVRAMYSYSMFLQATLTGLTDMVRRFRYEPEKVVRYGVATLVPTFAVLQAWNLTQLDDDGVPFTEKTSQPNSFAIALPKEIRDLTGMSVVEAPLGFTFAPIFAGLTKALVNHSAGRDISALQTTGAVADNLTRGIPSFGTLFPTAVQDLFTVTSGTTMQGRPITSPSLAGESTQEQVTPNNSMLAALAAEMGLSPGLADFMFSLVVPGMVGALVLDGIDTAVNQTGIVAEMPGIDWGTGAAKQYFSGPSDVNPEYKWFYSLYSELLPVMDKYSSLQKNATDEDATQEEIESYEKFHNENWPLVALYQTMEPVHDQMRSINAEMRRILKEPGQTPERELFGDPGKREQLNNLAQIRNDLFRQQIVAMKSTEEWAETRRELERFMYSPKARLQGEDSTSAGAAYPTPKDLIIGPVQSLLEYMDKAEVDKKASGISIEFPETQPE